MPNIHKMPQVHSIESFKMQHMTNPTMPLPWILGLDTSSQSLAAAEVLRASYGSSSRVVWERTAASFNTLKGLQINCLVTNQLRRQSGADLDLKLCPNVSLAFPSTLPQEGWSQKNLSRRSE